VQERLAALAKKEGIELTFFHGKGGTVGRGGNPATFEAILAHPPATINGRFRVTEQGEMITQNFGQAEIAERTLDLYTAALLAEKHHNKQEVGQEWRGLMDKMSDISCAAYVRAKRAGASEASTRRAKRAQRERSERSEHKEDAQSAAEACEHKEDAHLRRTRVNPSSLPPTKNNSHLRAHANSSLALPSLAQVQEDREGGRALRAVLQGRHARAGAHEPQHRQQARQEEGRGRRGEPEGHPLELRLDPD
jgi:hypothetical protein